MSKFCEAMLGHKTCLGPRLPRHRHLEGYIALVVRGGYSEAGDAGRFNVMEGHALIHLPFQSHLNLFWPRGAEVLNLPLPSILPAFKGLEASEVGRVLRLAASDPHEAAMELCGAATAALEPLDDWPDRLAASLRANPSLCIQAWAEAAGLHPSRVSREFGMVFGITPAKYRAEARARQAWQLITQGNDALADIAYAVGFSDQAHMTRDVASLTSLTPGAWRGRLRSRAA